MTRTALALLARWCLDAVASPPLAGEIEAVALLRFEQALRLPTDERDLLIRLLWSRSTTEAGADRQKGSETWH